MTSPSLFNMEFSQQSENYLDEMFGLSEDVLAADRDRDGSILDQDLYGVLKLRQSQPESLEDLLLQSPQGGNYTFLTLRFWANFCMKLYFFLTVSLF